MANLLYLMIIPCLLLSLNSSDAKSNHSCSPSSCGDVVNITSPFRLHTDPQHCGPFELFCENNLTLLYNTSFANHSSTYLVRSINYANNSTRVVESNLDKTNCSSLPNDDKTRSIETDTFDFYNPSSWELTKLIVFLKCENPVNSYDYVDTTTCDDGGSLGYQNSKTKTKTATAEADLQVSSSSPYYYVVERGFRVSDLAIGCCVELHTYISSDTVVNRSTTYVDIHNQLANGFELIWVQKFDSTLISYSENALDYFLDLIKSLATGLHAYVMSIPHGHLIRLDLAGCLMLGLDKGKGIADRS